MNDTPKLRVWELVIYGIPRTKKTSNEIHLTVNKKHVIAWIQRLAATISDPAHMMRMILMKVKVQPSKLWRAWAKDAPILGMPAQPIDCPVHIVATFYRERAIGDYTGYLQGLGDLLQERDVLKNDRLIAHFDGTRLAKDKDRPRTELYIYEESST